MNQEEKVKELMRRTGKGKLACEMWKSILTGEGK